MYTAATARQATSIATAGARSESRQRTSAGPSPGARGRPRRIHATSTIPRPTAIPASNVPRVSQRAGDSANVSATSQSQARRYDASRYSIGDRRRRQQAANAPVAPSPPRPTTRRSRPAPSLTGGLQSTVRAPTRAEHRHDRRAGDGGRHAAPGVRFSVLVPSRGRC